MDAYLIIRRIEGEAPAKSREEREFARSQIAESREERDDHGEDN